MSAAHLLSGRQLGFASSSICGTHLPIVSCPCRVRAAFRLEISAAAIGPGKKWEHYELNKNKNVVRVPMHVQSGDTVQVVAGADKGKVGEVKTVLTKTGKIVVEGVNIKYRTKQPAAQGEKGEIIQTESPIHHSNVMLYSKEKETRSRVGHKILENGKKVRYLVRTGEVIDNK